MWIIWFFYNYNYSNIIQYNPNKYVFYSDVNTINITNKDLLFNIKDLNSFNSFLLENWVVLLLNNKEETRLEAFNNIELNYLDYYNYNNLVLEKFISIINNKELIINSNDLVLNYYYNFDVLDIDFIVNWKNIFSSLNEKYNWEIFTYFEWKIIEKEENIKSERQFLITDIDSSLISDNEEDFYIWLDIKIIDNLVYINMINDSLSWDKYIYFKNDNKYYSLYPWIYYLNSLNKYYIDLIFSNDTQFILNHNENNYIWKK